MFFLLSFSLDSSMAILCSPQYSCTFLFLLFLIAATRNQFHLVSSAILLHHHNYNHNNVQHQKPMTQSIKTSNNTCSLFEGTWVIDEEYPLYQSYNCSVIDPEFNCQMYGRPDSSYLKYRWKPLNCELPRFNGVEFLMNMKGKTVMFVGDSLGRNQWQSLICMLSSAVPKAETQFVRGDPLSTFKFLDYGVNISFFRAPYLVDLDVVLGKRILRLDEVGRNGDAWLSADVLSFNTGHWWSHQGSLQGWDYVEMGGKYYPDMDRLAALERGMKTWANWVDTNLYTNITKLFFQAISPTHYNPSEWNNARGKTTVMTKATNNCYGETEPISGISSSSYSVGSSSSYREQMRIVDMVIREMYKPAYLMDITFMSSLRKDGHPSIYSGELSPQQRANPVHSADCSHWCLPGLPDTWNELFYAALFY